MAAIFSPDGRGWTAKYASRERFSGAAMEVLFLEKRLRYRLQQVGLINNKEKKKIVSFWTKSNIFIRQRINKKQTRNR